METNLLMLQILAGALLAGFVQGVSGFAYVLIATSVWVWFLSPQVLVPMVVCSSLIAQLGSIREVAEHFDFPRFAPFMLGGLLGVPIGVTAFSLISENVFHFTVGAILIGYSAIMLLRTSMPVLQGGGKPADIAVGALSGMMGGLGGFSGPPLVIWCALRGWNRHVQRSTFQPIIFMIGLFSSAMFAMNGTFTAASVKGILLAAPASLFASWLGTRAYRYLPEQAFRKILLCLLLLAGIALVTPIALAVLGPGRAA